MNDSSAEKQIADVGLPGTGKGRLLIVDDDPVASGMLGAMLTKDGYEVKAAASGNACLDAMNEFVPQVILLDIEMPGLDGYETCCRVRGQFDRADLTIIFLSAHDTLEERLQAYDVGGDDFVSKPFDAEEIRCKIALAVNARLRRRTVIAEKTSLEETVNVAMRSYSETGAALRFSRGALRCRTLVSLGELMIDSMRATDSVCHVQLRGSAAAGTVTMTPVGAASPLEESVIERMRSHDRVFQFKSRMIINYATASVMVVNMPDSDEALAGRIRDQAAMVAETAQDAIENISMRADAVARAKDLKVLAESGRKGVEGLLARYLGQQQDTHSELEQMVGKVEAMYYRLGLSDHQEALISDTVRLSRDEVLRLLDQFGEDFERQLAAILDRLNEASTYQIDMEEISAPVDELWG